MVNCAAILEVDVAWEVWKIRVPCGLNVLVPTVHCWPGAVEASANAMVVKERSVTRISADRVATFSLVCIEPDHAGVTSYAFWVCGSKCGT